jgi:hypothetical protein
MKNNPFLMTEFDNYAVDYELALAEGHSISGRIGVTSLKVVSHGWRVACANC